MPREAEARSFRYASRSRDDVRDRANMKGGDFDSIFKSKFKQYKVRDGKNLIRILPPTWEGARHYGFDLWINYNIGSDNQAYLSLRKMRDEKDPLEEAMREADREGDKDLAKALKPRQRILMWVIDRNDEDEGPMLFSCPFTLDKAIANLSFDEDTKGVVHVDGNDNPDEGCDVRFYKEGSGLKTDYPAEKIKIFETTPLCDDSKLADEWLAFTQKNPLPTVLEYHDYDHINKVFNGQIGSRGTTKDKDEDERPRRSRRDEDEERPARRRSEPVDDDPPPRTSRARATVEEDEPPFEATRTTRKPADEDEAPAKREPEERPSIRDRLNSRRTRVEEDD